MDMEDEAGAVLRCTLKAYGLDEMVMERLKEYMAMLGGRSRWAGLASRKNADDPRKAVAESLGVLEVADPAEKDVVDIGSGGGLLGIPLAVACPAWRVALLEPSGRKCVFLAEAIGQIGLPGARVLQGRAEGYAGREFFDLALTRAAGKLGLTAGVALPLLRPGGRYVALKGSDAREEADGATGAIRDSGGALSAVLVGGEGARGLPAGTSLVVVEKL